MESTIISTNYEKAVEVLSDELLFEDLVELAPDQYPKGAVKKAEGENWSLWVKDNFNYAVILGVGVFLILQ